MGSQRPAAADHVAGGGQSGPPRVPVPQALSDGGTHGTGHGDGKLLGRRRPRPRKRPKRGHGS
eukprot:3061774-Prorocentrum_lima.AAC.1